MDKEDLQTLRLMDEIDHNGIHSQRELSQRLNISLGLVNTFLKRLVNKGYFKATTMPRNRVKYFLTPEGLARKAKLTAEYLHYSVNFYRNIKNLLLDKYAEMEKNQVKAILFYGAGEVADLAYLYLQLTTSRTRTINGGLASSTIQPGATRRGPTIGFGLVLVGPSGGILRTTAGC